MSSGRLWFPQPQSQSRVWSQPAPTQLYELRGALVPAGSKPEPVFATLVYELREALVPPALRGGGGGQYCARALHIRKHGPPPGWGWWCGGAVDEIREARSPSVRPGWIRFHPRGEPRMKPPSGIPFSLVLKQINVINEIENIFFKASRAGPDLLPS